MGSPATRQGEQELQARVVGPVQVLDDDQPRPRRGRGGEELGQRAEGAALLALGVRRRGQGAGARALARGRGHDCRQLGQQRDQALGRRAELARAVAGAPTPQEGAQQIEQGRVGDDAVGLVAAALEDGEAPPLRPPSHLAHQARLADAGFAGQQHGRAAAGAGLLHQALERRDEGRAANEHRADDRLVKGQRHRSYSVCRGRRGRRLAAGRSGRSTSIVGVRAAIIAWMRGAPRRKWLSNRQTLALAANLVMRSFTHVCSHPWQKNGPPWRQHVSAGMGSTH